MEPVNITGLNFLTSTNSPLHHTDKFVGLRQGHDIILRRGQDFVIHFSTSGRDFDADIDLVRLSFSFGSDGKTTKNTKGVTTVEKAYPPKTTGWLSQVSEQHYGIFIVRISTPADIPVGVWMFQVEVGLRRSKLQSTQFAQPVYFLFNPWCPDDSTFMPQQDLLDEYVLNDVGKIWVGAYGSSRGRHWVFGQFDKYVLPACILILERSKLHPTARGDPVRVSRAISKLVNANDDHGVLVGKWSEPYSKGTPPSAWTGSALILKEFLLTGKEVRYGQCWVFAGILTTVCRALGLPSRVVSNLVSAHDSNASLTIDRFYDEDLKTVYPNDMSNDSIWNFHVWNDVWMARPLLPPGYGGWQAVDATPQETSDGVFQCGPASVRAVKAGEISLPYDGGFLYSTVNADIIRWKEDKSSDFGFLQIHSIKDEIGKMILTKKPFLYDPNGDRDREEITNQYKHTEGTTNERLVVFKAVAQNDEAKKYYSMPDKDESDVKFKLRKLERIMVGENYSIAMKVKNKGKETRSVKALLSSISVFYTGVGAHDVKSSSTQITLPPGTKQELSMTVSAAEYLPHLVEYGIMKISAICTVCETNQTWAEEDDFQVLKPNIIIDVMDKLYENQPSRIKLSFKNPLTTPLTKSFFSYEASGVSKSTMLRVGTVAANAEATATFSITPKRAGTYHLIASFYSQQLNDVTGSTEIKVKSE